MGTYIILAAGKGRSLEPLTLKYPKTSYKLDEQTTVLQRQVRGIRKFERNAEIVVVLGYMAETVKAELHDENVRFVTNPFYEVTNSISSLWFARSYLERENVAIIHADTVFEDRLIQERLVKSTDYPYVLVDSSCSRPGAYNCVIKDGKIQVMSKKLEHFDAKYCSLVKLDPVSSRLLKNEIDEMIHADMHDQYYEDALVQMIMFHNFQVNCVDIKDYGWSEVNSVDDLLHAREIHMNSILAVS